MKPFLSNHAKRRTALIATVVWLFALASGMTNACLLEAPGTHAHAALHRHAESAHHAASSTDAAIADDDHDDDDDADSPKEACLKACDDGSNAQVKLKASFDLLDPGLAPIVATAWHAATIEISDASRISDLQPSIVGPPFRVRFSRLTL